jgi:hypothetical protein
MPPIYVIVAFHRQRRRWRVAAIEADEFVARVRATKLRPTHYQHARVFELSER